MSNRFHAACTVVSLALSLLSAAPPDAPLYSNPADIAIGHQLITPQKLKMHLSFIASDELEGRATPSRGLDLAARYIASHMEYYGYQPAGDDGTYFQRISMSRRKASKQSRLRVASRGFIADFNLGVDFVGFGGDVKAKLVFAGFGLSSQEAGYDDYAALDVKDKLVIAFDGYPAGMNPDLFKVERKLGNQTTRVALSKYLIAKERGALGAITLKGPEFTARSDGKPSRFEQALTGLERESVIFNFRETARPLEIDLTEAAAGRLGQVLGLDLAAIKRRIDEVKKPQPQNIEASFEAEFKDEVVEKLSTQNVVAFLEGSDPKLKEEIIAFSAHYDHLGVHRSSAAAAPPEAAGSPPQSADTIFNGADDDGSGTVGLLNLAEVFSTVSRPRRSILFIWHAGEEKGLIGSDYYVLHPAKPLDKMAALFNIDMIGRNFEDKEENSNHVYLVGAAKTSQDLKQLIHRVCGDRMRLDETDPRNYFHRSDHYNYAKHRVPVAFFCTGEHKDYHRPSDEVKSILFDKMKTILEIVFESSLEAANQDTRPVFSGEGLEPAKN